MFKYLIFQYGVTSYGGRILRHGNSSAVGTNCYLTHGYLWLFFCCASCLSHYLPFFFYTLGCFHCGLCRFWASSWTVVGACLIFRLPIASPKLILSQLTFFLPSLADMPLLQCFCSRFAVVTDRTGSPCTRVPVSRNHFVALSFAYVSQGTQQARQAGQKIFYAAIMVNFFYLLDIM